MRIYGEISGDTGLSLLDGLPLRPSDLIHAVLSLSRLKSSDLTFQSRYLYGYTQLLPNKRKTKGLEFHVEHLLKLVINVYYGYLYTIIIQTQTFKLIHYEKLKKHCTIDRKSW